MTLPSVPTRTANRAEVDAALTGVDERLDALESGGGSGGPHTHTTSQITGFTTDVNTLVQAAVSALMAGAPGALDTLDELAAALGDDQNFAASVTSALAGKQPLHAVLTQLSAMTLADNTVIARQAGVLNLISFAALKTALALATVASTGAYADLSGTPSIPDSPDDIGAAAVVHQHTSGDVTDFNTAVDGRIALVIDAAPASLDTLNELAAALGDDPNFAGTITTLIGTKQPLSAVLTQLAAIAAADNDVIQRKAGSFTNRTPAQLKTDLSLTKSDVGLSNVDNTSDANKPVSTAQQAALDLKANTSDVILKTLIDAAGDILVGTADNTIARMAKGANGTFLGVSGGALGYYTPSGGGGGSPALKARTDSGMFTGSFGPCGIAGSWTVCPAAFRSVPITAAVDDILDWRPSVILGVGTATSDAEFDLAAIDNSNTGAPVILRCLSSGTNTPLANGSGGMYCWRDNARRLPGVADWKVTSADLVGGTVTFALLYRANASGLAVGHASVYPSRVTVLNFGPANA